MAIKRNQQVKTCAINYMCTRFHSFRAFGGAEKYIKMDEISSSKIGLTFYGLDGQGIESRWGRDFPYSSRPPLGPTQPPIRSVPTNSKG